MDVLEMDWCTVNTWGYLWFELYLCSHARNENWKFWRVAHTSQRQNCARFPSHAHLLLGSPGASIPSCTRTAERMDWYLQRENVCLCFLFHLICQSVRKLSAVVPAASSMPPPPAPPSPSIPLQINVGAIPTVCIHVCVLVRDCWCDRPASYCTLITGLHV